MEQLFPPVFLLRTLLPGHNQFAPGPPVALYDKRSDTNDQYKIPTPTSPDPAKPYVTLTFAQSLDAKIAGVGGKQLTLSGKDSMVMTHWMRTMHDAIMIGIGTALNDNPQLNTRHLPALSGSKYHLPRPIILDSSLRLPLDCKLIQNYKEGRGRRPWVIGQVSENSDWVTRKQALEAAGARVIEVKGRISIPVLLTTLRTLGIRSLMVEGGAQVIRSFFAEANSVNTIIVTVAPTFVGNDGVGYGDDLVSTALPNMEPTRTELFGRDAVMTLKVIR
ncbi:unnamed protein product [Somion occarium]|uniref:2,5-diamino-6-ribosylamino-4(3H)-pyrimidinone 5'-phosphate reductase n=2 Tax=Somion occarium TaxID=3059160 RepID=A0ABP1CF09_9APHY